MMFPSLTVQDYLNRKFDIKMATRIPIIKILLFSFLLVMGFAWIRVLLSLFYNPTFFTGNQVVVQEEGAHYIPLPRIEDFEPMVGISSTERQSPPKKCYFTSENGTKKTVSPRLIKENGCLKRLPNVVIIGAQFCGTDLLQFYLENHPFLEFPVNSSRQIHYFKWKETFFKGANWFRMQMPYTTTHQMTAHTNPGYLNSEVAPSRMKKELIPLTKFIVVLCEPVARLFVEYHNVKKKFGTTPPKQSAEMSSHPLVYPYYDAKPMVAQTLEQSLFQMGSGQFNYWNSLLNTGMYVTHLRRWFQYFGSDRFYVVRESWIARNPYKLLQKVENFIGLPSYFRKKHFVRKNEQQALCFRRQTNVCPEGYLEKNDTAIYRSINKDLLEKLNGFYKSYNDELSLFLNRDFYSWNDFSNFDAKQNKSRELNESKSTAAVMGVDEADCC